MFFIRQPKIAFAIKKSSLVIHASESWHDAVATGQFDFFEKLSQVAAEHGVETYLVPAQSRLSEKTYAMDHIHIAVGNTRSSATPDFYVAPSYVWGFWYCDPMGVFGESSITRKQFLPETIDKEAATYFFNGVSGYMLRENVSKFPQMDKGDATLKPARAVFFAQEIEKYKNKIHYLDTETILETMAREMSGRVYVKLHPDQSPEYCERFTRVCARFDNIEVSDRSIHELTSVSDIVVTQNSAAGFEALMQKKPIITCARTDYHHASQVATNQQELLEALRGVEMRQLGFSFEKYFYWFLAQHMFEPQKEEFAQKIWVLVAAKFK